MKNFKLIEKLGKISHSHLNLGTGTYSKVYKVERRSDSRVYALKQVTIPSPHFSGKNGKIIAEGKAKRCK